MNTLQRVIQRDIKEFEKSLPKFSPSKKIMTTGQTVQIGKNFDRILERIERVPVLFGPNTPEHIAQKRDYDFYLSYAKKVVKLIAESSGRKVDHLRNDLNRRIIGLRYRIEGINGGLDKAKELDFVLFKKMLLVAGEWKLNQKLHAEEDRRLLPSDEAKIEELCAYPEFCALLQKDPKLQEQFFGWSIREHNSVKAFIEYPAIADRVKNIHLSSKIGRIGMEHFAIMKKDVENREQASGIQEKVLCLPFQTKDGVKKISILDEKQQIELTHGWKQTIQQIFKMFLESDDCASNIEFFDETGITNYNAFEWGPWNPATNTYHRVDFSQKEWWKQIPVLEEITAEAAEKRYGTAPEAGKNKVYVISKRSHEDTDVVKRHSYFEIAIAKPNGKYQIIPVGLYPIAFPQNALDSLKFLASTVVARLIYPDTNKFLTKRQYAAHPLDLSDEKFDEFMAVMGKEISLGLQGNLTFKFIDENCSQHTDKIINTIVEQKTNYFEMPMVDSYPKDIILKGLFGFLRFLPPKIRGPVIRWILRGLGGKTGVFVDEDGKKVFRSVLGTNKPYHHIKIYNPAVLFNDIKNGRRKGKISSGI